MTLPGNWNPNSKVHAKNEANMLDFEGNVIEEQHRTRVLLAEVPECAALTNECQISAMESSAIDNLFEDSTPLPLQTTLNHNDVA